VESAYTVNEANDTGLPLCAELSDGILERSVTVMLNSMDGSATTLGKYETKLCQGTVGYMSYDLLPSHAISNLSYRNGNGIIMIYSRFLYLCNKRALHSLHLDNRSYVNNR